jgi:hypothetical protein
MMILSHSYYNFTAVVIYTGWSKSLCVPDDYNTYMYICIHGSICLAADRQGQGETSLITFWATFVYRLKYMGHVADRDQSPF